MNMLGGRFFPWLAAAAVVYLSGLTTAHAGMLSYVFDNINESVPDNSALGLSDSHVVSAPSDAIAQVTLTLKITGGYNGDLYAQVTHDNALAVLLNRVGKTTTNNDGYDDPGFTITFSDIATAGDVHIYRTTLFGNDNTSLDGPLTGTWAPDGRTVDPDLVTDQDPRISMLSSFNGFDPAGRWTLFIADNSAVGVSTLVSWELDITTVPEAGERTFVLAGMSALGILTGARKIRRARNLTQLLRGTPLGVGILSAVLVWMFAGSAAAALVWDQPTQEVKLTPDDRNAEVHFKFQNTGTEVATIKTISTSCGCTTAQLAKRTYQPGEKGEVIVHYVGDQRNGTQRKTIVVDTGDGSSPATLELRIIHQTLLEINPVFVYWRVGEPNDPKTVRLLTNDQPVRVTSVISSNPRISVTVHTLRENKEYSVLVQPTDTTQKEVAQISVETDYPSSNPIKYTMYARIVPLSQR